MPHVIRMKRIHAAPERDDGARVLVDRLWPRGLRRESLSLHEWYRDASPTHELRRAWHRKEISWEMFAHRYRREMDDTKDCLIPLMRLARLGPLTLLSATRDLERSHLPILRDALLEALAEEDHRAGDEPSSPPCYAGRHTPPM